MEESELKDIMNKAGYVITHSPYEVTHAICSIHGKIVLVTADDHMCCWKKSLKKHNTEVSGVPKSGHPLE